LRRGKINIDYFDHALAGLAPDLADEPAAGKPAPPTIWAENFREIHDASKDKLFQRRYKKKVSGGR